MIKTIDCTVSKWREWWMQNLIGQQTVIKIYKTVDLLNNRFCIISKYLKIVWYLIFDEHLIEM